MADKKEDMGKNWTPEAKQTWKETGEALDKEIKAAVNDFNNRQRQG